MSFRDRVIERLFGSAIEARVQAHLASVSVRVDDSRGWDSVSGGTIVDRVWSERASDLEDAIEAWRKSFLVRRIVTLVRSYVVGGGIRISSQVPAVDAFVQEFWEHRQNRLERRLGPMCDELTRAGELFPVLHTNRVDGMSYVRFVPASRIHSIETASNDYEIEKKYHELDAGEGPRTWYGVGYVRAFVPSPQRRLYPPLMLHFSVNKLIGATRGEGDLGPVLPWALRYSEWLKDRVRLNRQRTRNGLLDVKIADDSVVEQKRAQLRRTNPIEAGIYVHGPGEEVEMRNLQIGASDAKEDGLILRLAVATGANVALHYLGEGESVNYATAKEMGEPTARFFSERQQDFCAMLEDLVSAAYRRKVGLGLAEMPGDGDLGLRTSVTEVARADNLSLAQAADSVVKALAEMMRLGIADRETAARLAYKFAGEALTSEEIEQILSNAEPEEEEGSPQRRKDAKGREEEEEEEGGEDEGER